MTIHRLHVPDLSCGHCVAATTKALAQVPTLSGCAVDLPRREIRFALGDPAQLATAFARLDAAGYPAEPLPDNGKA